MDKPLDRDLCFRLDGSIAGQRIRYCGVRVRHHVDEKVYVQRGLEDAALLAPRADARIDNDPGDQGGFGWGYPGSAPNALALAILCDFYRVRVGDEPGCWPVKYRLDQPFADAFLNDAAHVWLITDEDIRDFVGRWAAGQILADRINRRHAKEPAASSYSSQEASQLTFLHQLIPEQVRRTQLIV